MDNQDPTHTSEVAKIARAIDIIKNKKGTGKSKHVKLLIKMDIHSTVIQTERALTRLLHLLHLSPLYSESMVTKVEVENEFEDSPDAF